MATSAARESAIFLPDLCGLRPLFVIVVVGELIAISLTLAVYGARPSTFDELALVSLFTQWIGLSAAAVLCFSRRYVAGSSETTVVIVSYLLVMGVVWLVAEMAWWVAQSGAGDPLIAISKSDFLIRVITIGGIVAALILRYFYVQYHWRRQTVSEAEARLEALQARIRPHFLFNCMNTIASLTRSNPVGAEKAIEDLSDLFRASMDTQRTVVTLEEELDLVRRYVDIEALRLGGRLEIVWRIDDGVLNHTIPLLTVQPLVENAIYHGIEPLPDGGVITIDVQQTDTGVAVTITNPVTDNTSPHHSGNRIALDNIKQRLQAHYGSASRMSTNIDDDTYTVTLAVPTAVPS